MNPSVIRIPWMSPIPWHGIAAATLTTLLGLLSLAMALDCQLARTGTWGFHHDTLDIDDASCKSDLTTAFHRKDETVMAIPKDGLYFGILRYEGFQQGELLYRWKNAQERSVDVYNVQGTGQCVFYQSDNTTAAILLFVGLGMLALLAIFLWTLTIVFTPKRYAILCERLTALLIAVALVLLTLATATMEPPMEAMLDHATDVSLLDCTQPTSDNHAMMTVRIWIYLMTAFIVWLGYGVPLLVHRSFAPLGPCCVVLLPPCSRTDGNNVEIVGTTPTTTPAPSTQQASTTLTTTPVPSTQQASLPPSEQCPTDKT